MLASPVAASLGRYSEADSIRFSWSRTTGVNDYLDETWWAVRGHDTPDNFVERLLSIPVRAIARGAGAGFEARVSQSTGLPLPESWSIATAKNSPFIASVYAETPRDLTAVLGFYRAELGKRGWIETVVEPDRAVITSTTARGPVLLRLSRQNDRTIAELSLRKPGIANTGLLPRPRQAKLMLGNKSDDEAVITVADQTIKLAAHAGEKLAHSDSAAAGNTGRPKRSICRPASTRSPSRSRAARSRAGSSRSRPTRPEACWPARTASCCRCGFIEAHRPLAVRKLRHPFAQFSRCAGDVRDVREGPRLHHHRPRQPHQRASLIARLRGSSISSKSMLWARPKIRRRVLAAAKPTVSVNSRCM